jgi:hypothetical protein
VKATAIAELEALVAEEPSIERLQRMAALLADIPPAPPPRDDQRAAGLVSTLAGLDLGSCSSDITEPRVRQLWERNARDWLNGQLATALKRQLDQLVSDAQRERRNQDANQRLETTRARTLGSLVGLLEELSATG